MKIIIIWDNGQETSIGLFNPESPCIQRVIDGKIFEGVQIFHSENGDIDIFDLRKARSVRLVKRKQE